MQEHVILSSAPILEICGNCGTITRYPKRCWYCRKDICHVCGVKDGDGTDCCEDCKETITKGEM
jgi:hypothetical protein